MNTKDEARKTQRGPWMIWGVAAVGFLFLLVMFAKALQINWALRSELSRLEPIVTAAYAENAVLEEKLAYVQSDEYVAEWSQVHARMTQGNETLIIPVHLTPTPTPVSVQVPEQTIQEPLFLKWWRALIGD